MKIKTSWLKNKKYLVYCLKLREQFPERFNNKKIEAGKLIKEKIYNGH